MKIDIEKETLDNIGLNQMGLNVNSLTFKTLIDGIYNNKLGAVIREISSNARDSHIKSNNLNPFEIILNVDESSLVSKLTIKDYGDGLSKEEMIKYLCTLNSSSKRDSNDFIGFLGIGSKSPFALVDNYNFTSYKNDKKIVLNFFRTNNETPHYDIVEETIQPTTNSVECNIAFTNTDITLTNILSEIYQQLILFDIKPNIIIKYVSGQVDIKTPEDFFSPVIETEDYYLIENDFKIQWMDLVKKYTESTMLISIGNVIYQYKYNNIVNYNLNSLKLYILKSNPEDLSFNEGREYIVNNPSNLEYITNKIKNIIFKLPVNSLINLLNSYKPNFPYFFHNTLRSYSSELDYIFPSNSFLNIEENFEETKDLLYFINSFSRFLNYLNISDKDIVYLKNNSLLDNFLKLISLHTSLTQLEYKELININIFTNPFKSPVIFNNIETKLESVIYLYVSSSTLKHLIQDYAVTQLLPKNTVLIIITTGKHNTCEYITQQFNNIVQYLPESKLFSALSFKKVYPEIYNLIKKPKVAKPVSTQPVERSTISVNGYPIGKKLQIKAIKNKTPIEINTTFVDFSKKISTSKYSYSYSDRFLLVSKNIIETEEEKKLFLEKSFANCHDEYRIIFVFEMDNTETFADLKEFFNIYYKDIDQGYNYFLVDYKSDIDYSEYRHIFLSRYISKYFNKSILNFFSKIPEDKKDKFYLFSNYLGINHYNQYFSLLPLLSLIHTDVYIENNFKSLRDYDLRYTKYFSKYGYIFSTYDEQLTELLLNKFNFNDLNLEIKEEAKQNTPEIDYVDLWNKFFPEDQIIEEE